MRKDDCRAAVTLHDLTIWGTLTGGDKVVIDGLVTGNGNIQTEVTNDGTVSPGASPGTLKVKGNYTQDPSASLKIEIAALAAVGTKYSSTAPAPWNWLSRPPNLQACGSCAVLVYG